MSEYKDDYTKNFKKDFVKIRSSQLEKRLNHKIDESLDNPHKKSLRNILKGKRRVHVGSYVLIYEINEREKTVIFHRFQSHDKAYKKKI